MKWPFVEITKTERDQQVPYKHFYKHVHMVTLTNKYWLLSGAVKPAPLNLDSPGSLTNSWTTITIEHMAIASVTLDRRILPESAPNIEHSALHSLTEMSATGTRQTTKQPQDNGEELCCSKNKNTHTWPQLTPHMSTEQELTCWNSPGHFHPTPAKPNQISPPRSWRAPSACRSPSDNGSPTPGSFA